MEKDTEIVPVIPVVPMTWGDDGLFFRSFKDKRKFRYVRMEGDVLMKVWEQTMDGSWHKEQLGVIKVHDVEMDALKSIGVWDSLSSKVQEEIMAGVVQKKAESEAVKEELIARLAVARASRKTKYVNIPKEITCTECHNAIPVVPAVIAKRVEKMGILLVDYIRDFKCYECVPAKRGRKKVLTE